MLQVDNEWRKCAVRGYLACCYGGTQAAALSPDYVESFRGSNHNTKSSMWVFLRRAQMLKQSTLLIAIFLNI